MSLEQDLWRLRRSSSFVLSWVILHSPGVHWKWHSLRSVFYKTEEIHWCEWKAQMRTRWPHAVCPIKTLAWFLSKRQLEGWEDFSSFIKSGYGFLLSQTTSSAVRLAGKGSSIQEDSQRGWLIPKALFPVVKRTFTRLIEAMCSVRPLKFKWCLPLCVPLTALKAPIKGEQQRRDRHELKENRKTKSNSSQK